jgi:glycosyltransferase involved in cell wall biosynthesis
MKSVLQGIAKGVLKAVSVGWKPYSRLILYGDSSGWVLDWEMRELNSICARLGVPVVKPLWKHAYNPQSIFFSNQFFLQNDDWIELLPHRIGFAYFHGLPDTGINEFDNVYRALKKHHEKLSRIQVSHTEMRDAVLQTGVDPSKVFLVPIGINLSYFPYRSADQKRKARLDLGVPQSAFMVGSFQKDGVGWEDGLEPKLIKGPDVFVETMKRLKKDIPELFVMLSGPARGYVRKGLEEADIPFLHIYLQSYPDIAKLFQALDLYVVASRQEGGPKAVLESMASGVPLVTTKVGQAMDLVRHGENAFMTDVEDVEALASYSLQVYRSNHDALQSILKAGRMTAEANSYESQFPLWAEFMKGFVQ